MTITIEAPRSRVAGKLRAAITDSRIWLMLALIGTVFAGAGLVWGTVPDVELVADWIALVGIAAMGVGTVVWVITAEFESD